MAAMSFFIRSYKDSNELQFSKLIVIRVLGILTVENFTAGTLKAQRLRREELNRQDARAPGIARKTSVYIR